MAMMAKDASSTSAGFWADEFRPGAELLSGGVWQHVFPVIPSVGSE